MSKSKVLRAYATEWFRNRKSVLKRILMIIFAVIFTSLRHFNITIFSTSHSNCITTYFTNRLDDFGYDGLLYGTQKDWMK